MRPFIKLETTKTFTSFFEIELVIILTDVAVLRSCCVTDLELRIINGMSREEIDNWIREGIIREKKIVK